jgi:CDP-glucose 4,6-dehydratase
MKPSASFCEGLFGGVYAGRRVLLTGHTGFKGSWMALWLRQLGAQVSTLALPAETSPSHHEALSQWAKAQPPGLAPLVHETLADLRDAQAVVDAVQAAQPEFVFHLAAQALVRPGYADPAATYATNVMGLVHVLEAVRQCPSVRVMLNVTTDKCYENVQTSVGYVESDKLGGHDPYSASKACAELVTASYRSSFLGLGDRPGGLVGLATARAGNVIGGGDWSTDRLVPDLMRAAMTGQVVPIRNPLATRPWQHVLEPLAAYLHLGHRLWQDPLVHARAWNFGPSSEGHLSVGTMVELFASRWPAIRCAHDAGSHPHEAQLLHLDCSAAHELLDWHPVWPLEAMIDATTHWYRQWHEAGALITHQQLTQFVNDARQARAVWAS